MRKKWMKNDIELLKEMVAQKTPLKVVGNFFGVSQNSISKTLQRYCSGYAIQSIKKQDLQSQIHSKNEMLNLNNHEQKIVYNIIGSLKHMYLDINKCYRSQMVTRRLFLLELNKKLVQNKIKPISYEEFLKIQCQIFFL